MSPWFDFLQASPDVLGDLIGGTGWSIKRLVQDEGLYYVAILA